MPEQLTFRERQLATCRQKMFTTREEAVALLTRARQQSIDVGGAHKFKKPGIGDKIPQGKLGETIVNALSRFLSQSGAKQYDPNAEHRDWTQNPEYIARQFLDQVIEIFKHEPVDDLMYSVEKCMADFKREYPHADAYIDHTEKTLMIKLMIRELWMGRQLEEFRTILLFIAANQRGIKEAVLEQLNK